MGNAASQCPALDDPAMQWPYCPSFPAAVAITACFATLTVAHCFQAIIYRKKFCWVICMATAWETAGFTMRLLGARDPRKQTFSIGSNLLILLSPLWVNAFAYMVVGRMIYYWLPNRSVWKIKARTMTGWFVWLDVITFFIQATGGSMIENDDPKQAKLGLYIYMGGIGLQQGFLILFVLIMIKFHLDVRRIGRHQPTSWRPQLYSLYVALTLITVRIIFRLVEFSSGINGPIPKNESYFYALEATPMVLAIGTFAVIHPGRTLTGSESEFSRLIIEKGKRRWWCCGRRARTKLDPDFEMNNWVEDGSRSPPGARETLPLHEPRRSGERRSGKRGHRSHRHHSRRYSSRRQSDKQVLWDPVRAA